MKLISSARDNLICA